MQPHTAPSSGLQATRKSNALVSFVSSSPPTEVPENLGNKGSPNRVRSEEHDQGKGAPPMGLSTTPSHREYPSDYPQVWPHRSPTSERACPAQHQKPKSSEQQVTLRVTDLRLLLQRQAGLQGRRCAWCLPVPAEPLPLQCTQSPLTAQEPDGSKESDLRARATSGPISRAREGPISRAREGGLQGLQDPRETRERPDLGPLMRPQV